MALVCALEEALALALEVKNWLARAFALKHLHFADKFQRLTHRGTLGDPGEAAAQIAVEG